MDWSIEKVKERTQSQILWPSIPKVPHMLRGTQDFKIFYEPRVVGALLHVSVHMSVHMPLPHDTIWITTAVPGAFYPDNTSMPQIATPLPLPLANNILQPYFKSSLLHIIIFI